MRLTPFDLFEVKWFNSRIFYKLYEYMHVNEDMREETTTLHYLLTLSVAYVTTRVPQRPTEVQSTGLDRDRQSIKMGL